MYSESIISACEIEMFPPLLLTHQCKKKIMLVILWTFSASKDLQSRGIDSCWLQSRIEICAYDQADMA